MHGGFRRRACREALGTMSSLDAEVGATGIEPGVALDEPRVPCSPDPGDGTLG